MSGRVDEIIEKALKSEPKLEFSEGFADKVVRTIRKKESQNQRKLYLWMALGCLVMFAFGFAIMKTFVPGYLDGFSGDQFNKVIPLAVIIGLIVVFIQYLDQKLVKEKYLFG